MILILPMKKLTARFLENLALQEAQVNAFKQLLMCFPLWKTMKSLYSYQLMKYMSNQPSAKTVLAAMINFLRGSPAFVARLVPVANSKHGLLVDLLLVLVSIYP